MAVCSACGSTRVRNDYKPAPWWLRLIGVRALLCDYCNHQFRAFAPLPPKTRRPRQITQKADVFNHAPVVNLHQLDRRDPTPKPAPQAEPARIINLNRAPLVDEQPTPARNGLRTQITRLHAQAKGEQVAPPEQTAPAATSAPACPECGSQNLKRRHRNTVEKAVLSFTAHKAYNCRDCGAAFYAKKEAEDAPPQPRPAERNLLESTPLNRERGWPKRER